ncbi:MAG: hypothetical protein R2824_28005 [Saprospiraceae bacterium]|nr:hypothetical protein [Lewinella sp.]
MRTIISCVAYKNFDEVKSRCKELELAINEGLKNNQYGPIRFLTPRCSFVNLLEPEVPYLLDQNNLSFTVLIEGEQTSHIATALVKGLHDQAVPENLRTDIINIFRTKGWLADSMA